MTTPNHERMSSVDTAWLRMDSPSSMMMIVGVSATATPVRPVDFRRMIEQRVLCFPRFRHKAVPDIVGASWVEDDEFDLEEHLVEIELPAPAGKAELETLVGELASTPLDPQRPMWQVHLVLHYGAGSAWILRVHHCYADGIAMVRVLLSMTEQDPGPASGAGVARRVGKARHAPKRAPDVLPILSWVQQLTQPAGDILERALADGAKLIEGGVHQLFHPDRVAALAARVGGMASEFVKVTLLPDDPPTPLRGPLSGYKSVAWSDPIQLHEVRTIGKALDCTINDVLMSTAAGALGSYLRERGFDTGGGVLRASVPVNLRAAEEPLTLGNKFGLVFVDMAVGIVNPLERLYAMHDVMAALKGSMQPPMSLVTLAVLGALPAAVQTPAIDLFSRKASAVISNVPGPQSPLYLCGQRISEMYFWVPQSGTIGLGVSILSYAGQVHFGVIADRHVVASPAAIVDRFTAEFERLLLATMVGTLALRVSSRRRIDAGARPERRAGTGPGRSKRDSTPAPRRPKGATGTAA